MWGGWLSLEAGCGYYELGELLHFLHGLTLIGEMVTIGFSSTMITVRYGSTAMTISFSSLAAVVGFDSTAMTVTF